MNIDKNYQIAMQKLQEKKLPAFTYMVLAFKISF